MLNECIYTWVVDRWSVRLSWDQYWSCQISADRAILALAVTDVSCDVIGEKCGAYTGWLIYLSDRNTFFPFFLLAEGALAGDLIRVNKERRLLLPSYTWLISLCMLICRNWRLSFLFHKWKASIPCAAIDIVSVKMSLQIASFHSRNILYGFQRVYSCKKNLLAFSRTKRKGQSNDRRGPRRNNAAMRYVIHFIVILNAIEIISASLMSVEDLLPKLCRWLRTFFFSGGLETLRA